MNKLIIPLLAGAVLTGCADGNIHEFLNGDFLNSTAPGIATLGKMFYPDRYGFTRDQVPPAFANTAPDHIGKWDFLGFTANNERTLFIANYYDPASVKQKGSHGDVTTLVVFSATQHSKSKKPFLSAVIVNEMDCSNRTFRYLSIDAYASTRPLGSPVSKNDTSKITKPYPVGHDTLEERVLNKVCS